MTGVEPKLDTGGGTSDARFIARFCPVAEFGLVGRAACTRWTSACRWRSCAALAASMPAVLAGVPAAPRRCVSARRVRRARAAGHRAAGRGRRTGWRSSARHGEAFLASLAPLIAFPGAGRRCWWRCMAAGRAAGSAGHGVRPARAAGAVLRAGALLGAGGAVAALRDGASTGASGRSRPGGPMLLVGLRC